MSKTTPSTKPALRDELERNLIGSQTIKNLCANNAHFDHKQFVAKVIGTVMADEQLQK